MSRSVPTMVKAVAPDVVTSVRTTRGGTGRVIIHTAAPATTPLATTAAAPASRARRRIDLAVSRAAVVAASTCWRRAAFSRSIEAWSSGVDAERPGDSSMRTSAAATSARRFRRSLSRHRRSSIRIAGGTSDGSACQSGSTFSTFASVSEMSSPSNARFPVSIS